MGEGSGGLGAVSVGITHPLALLVLVLLAIVVLFGAWKLVKLLLAVIGG